MAAVAHLSRDGRVVAVGKDHSQRTVGIGKGHVVETVGPPSLGVDAVGTGLNHCREVGNHQVVRVQSVALVVVGYVDGSVAGLATAVEVGSLVHVEHEVPHQYGAAVLQRGGNSHVLHVRNEACAEVAAIVPLAYRCLGEYQFLVWSLVVDDVEFVGRAAVVVVGRTYYQLRAFHIRSCSCGPRDIFWW